MFCIVHISINELNANLILLNIIEIIKNKLYLSLFILVPIFFTNNEVVLYIAIVWIM